MRLLAVLTLIVLALLACAGDPCGDERGGVEFGGACQQDCDCEEGMDCYTDDYGDNCCAEEIDQLQDEDWTGDPVLDCDEVQ